MYCVVAQRNIPFPAERVWCFLTEPPLLAQWFADTESFRDRNPFRFDFGDGDFFCGHVEEWDDNTFLSLRWRFVAMGPEYEVRFSLLRRKEGTEVSIQDRGALTIEEAECLRVGWSEFLMRLDKCMSRTCVTRFAWRKALTCTGCVNGTSDYVLDALSDPEWYHRNLPVIAPALPRRDGSGIVVRLQSERWFEVSTSACLTVKQVRGREYLFLAHEGWPNLPAELAPLERRRFVDIWRQALGNLYIT